MPITYFATNRKQGDGSTTAWDFSFAGARPDANNGTAPYLETDDVRVALVEVTPDGEELREEIAFTFGPGPSQVTIEPAVADGQDFVIYRETESGIPVADFTDFAAIDEQDLDNGFRQTLYVVQELQDRVLDSNSTALTALTAASEAVVVANSSVATADQALSTANQANSTANQATNVAISATNTANTASNQASTALSTANAANIAANQAQDDVAEALTNSSTAVQVAQTANTTANTASDRALSAETAANTAVSTANTANTTANAALTQSNQALSTANTAITTANDADFKADQAIADAGLVVNFQFQLDQLEDTVADLTGVEPGAIALNSENLSGLEDFAAARENLDVYSTAEVSAEIAAALEDIDVDLTPVEMQIDALDVRVTDVESSVGSLGTQVTANTSAIGTLETTVGDISSSVSTLTTAVDTLDTNKANKAVSIVASNGLTGGGDLSGNVILSMGTPGALNGGTTNNVTATSHTHSIASTSLRTSSSTTTLLQAKAMHDHRVSSDHDFRYTTRANNLSDLNNASTARSNLGLGSAALSNASTSTSASTVILRDSGGRAKVSAPVASGDIARKAEVDAVTSQLAGFGSDARSMGSANNLSAGSRGNFEGSESAAVAAGLPSLGGSTEPRHWAIDSFGSESPNRTVQIATEVFGVGGAKGRTFIRVRHDNDWSSWSEIGASTPTPNVGEVGSYAMLIRRNNGVSSPGSTLAGNALFYSAADGHSVTNPAPAGTWRCMGYAAGNSGGTSVAVWLRIS